MPKIKCTNCGKLKGAGEPRYSKLVEQADSKEQLEATFLCRVCKKEKKQQAKAEAKPEEKPVEVPKEKTTPEVEQSIKEEN